MSLVSGSTSSSIKRPNENLDVSGLFNLPININVPDKPDKDYVNNIHSRVFKDFKSNPSKYTSFMDMHVEKTGDSSAFKENGVWSFRNPGGMFGSTLKSVAEANAMYNVAQYLIHVTKTKQAMEQTAERTWGGDYKNEKEFQEWASRTKEKLGDFSPKSVLNGVAGENKSWKDIPLVQAQYIQKESSWVKDFVSTVNDIGEVAADVTVGVLTAPATLPVAAVEAVDDIVEGENIGETLLNTGLNVTNTQDLVDAANDLAEGDVVGAIANTYEYGYNQQANIDQGSFGSTGATADAISSEVIEGMEEISDPDKDNLLSNLREDINELAMGEDIPIEPEKELKMPNLEKTTMKELKILLGVAEDSPDEDVVKALIGTEARQLAADPDIARMRQLQGQVAERGYDVGEREALSAKARRELAGMARQQGMAAGAAAGGLRGASVAAQSRALSEKAMQKQADVTTEMDKASIARKDAARQQLATLAKDVTKFDIEKEQERKKRKGATTIGVQSLLQQEDIAKQQYELAQMD